MIDLYQSVVLVLLQGLTELLPVSSAAHLLFPSILLGWPDHGLAFDMAVQVGTLSATLLDYGLLLGLSRQSVAGFSFSLSIPIIASAGMLKIWELASGDPSVDWLSLGLGVAVSGISAYACKAAFLHLLDKMGFMPFVYYRIALALALCRLWQKATYRACKDRAGSNSAADILRDTACGVRTMRDRVKAKYMTGRNDEPGRI